MTKKISRRRFLTGVGGSMLALPWLSQFAGRSAWASGDLGPQPVADFGARVARMAAERALEEEEEAQPLTAGGVS